jgi:hypothetical protein
MIDAYDLHTKIIDAWRSLIINPSGGFVKKEWPVVPVYVEVNGELKAVDTLVTEDHKIILKIK